MKGLLKIAAVVAVLGVVAVIVSGAVTSAQEGDGPIGTFVEKLAAKLGIGEDKLKTAIEETQSEMIDEAVAEGRLTEEQAERLKERAGEGGFFGFPGRGLGHGRWGAGVMPEAAAEVLGISVDQLMEELRDGKSLDEVAEEQHGMTVDEFTDALLSQVKAQLDGLVAEGKLTQEQADGMFEQIEENIDSIVSGEGGLGGFGGPPQGPGDLGPWHGPPSEEEAESTEASGVTA